jgi:hypothetical protein
LVEEVGGEKRETVLEKEGRASAFWRYGRILFEWVEYWSSRDEGAGFE